MDLKKLAAGLLLGAIAVFGLAAVAGVQLRCVSIPGGYFWERDLGPQQDSKLAYDATAQQRDESYQYCTQHSQRPCECRVIVYGGDQPDYSGHGSE